MATFIDGANRLLRTAHVIKGDDDNITAFTDTQHAADISLAQIAIQDELVSLIAERLIPYEKTSATISLVTSTRTYALASDFIRFYGTRPSFYDSTDNTRTYEYKGGEDDLRDSDFEYKTTEGSPDFWYWDNTTTKKVAFYSVPQSSYNGRSLSYDYEKSVIVSLSTDTLPFHNVEEYYSFISMATRRFQILIQEQQIGVLEQDTTYNSAKVRLYELLNPKNPRKKYGNTYF